MIASGVLGGMCGTASASALATTGGPPGAIATWCDIRLGAPLGHTSVGVPQVHVALNDMFNDVIRYPLSCRRLWRWCSPHSRSAGRSVASSKRDDAIIYRFQLDHRSHSILAWVYGSTQYSHFDLSVVCPCAWLVGPSLGGCDRHGQGMGLAKGVFRIGPPPDLQPGCRNKAPRDGQLEASTCPRQI